MKHIIKRKVSGNSTMSKLARFSILLTDKYDRATILTGWQDKHNEQYLTRYAIK